MSVRQDFINAYVAQWGCSTEYAAGLMEHVEAEMTQELSEAQKKFFGDVTSQGNDGNWYGMSDWLTEDKK